MTGQFNASDFFDIFLQEANELIETMDRAVIGLEQDPSSAELIEAIFRAAHSLKASAASQGLEQMSEISHALENVFDRIRNNSLAADAGLIDRLLEGIDALKHHLKCAVEDESAPDYSSLQRSLQALADGQADNGLEDDPQHQDAMRPYPVQSSPPGATILRISLDEACSMPAARAWLILQQLRGYGEVVRSMPAEESLQDEECNFEHIDAAIETSLDDEDLVRLTSELPDVACVQLVDNECGTATPENASRTGDHRESSPVGNLSVKQSTVRVHVENIDALMNLVGELVINRTRLTNLTGQLRDSNGHHDADLSQSLEQVTTSMGMLVTELQERVMQTRMVPVRQVFGRFPRLIRDVARREGKGVDLQMEGGETELDRSVIEDIVDPLTHLLRNAVSHGIEPPDQRNDAGKPPDGTVGLSARQEESTVVIEVSDDGKGIDPDAIRESAVNRGVVSQQQASTMSDAQALDLIFAPGFSTAGEVSDVSGRGVGMDVVRNNIDRLGGQVEIDSTPGEGSTISLRLPLTLAIIQGLLVETAGIIFALPLSSVHRILRVATTDVSRVGGVPCVIEQDRSLPLLSLAQIGNLQKSEDICADTIIAVLVGDGRTQVGLVVEQLIGNEELVIQPLGDVLQSVKMVNGAAILGDGRLALIVDIATLLRRLSDDGRAAA